MKMRTSIKLTGLFTLFTVFIIFLSLSHGEPEAQQMQEEDVFDLKVQYLDMCIDKGTKPSLCECALDLIEKDRYYEDVRIYLSQDKKRLELDMYTFLNECQRRNITIN